MKFKINDRLNLLQTLPAVAGYDELCLIRVIYKKFTFSDEEKKKYNIRFLPQGIQTDPEFDLEEFDIELGKTEMDYIVDILSKMNLEEKLNIGLLDLFELFLPPAGDVSTEDETIKNIETL